MTGVKAVVLLSPPRETGRGGTAYELMSVANRPIVSHALRALTAAGVTDVAFVGRANQLGRLRRVLSTEAKVSSEIRYIEQRNGGGPAEALRQADSFLHGAPCVVQYANGLLAESLKPLVNSLATCSFDALVLVKKPSGVVDERASRARLLHLLSNGTDEELELADFYMFGADAARTISGLPSRRTLPAVVEELLEHGRQVQAHCVRGSFTYCGSDDELLEANRFVLDAISADIPRGTVRKSAVQGRVVVHPTARVSSALIRGPAIIGAGAQVRGAYIGPYTSVGEGVLIDGAEIEHSILLAGARITHPRLRLEASVVGAGAQVIRGAQRPTAVRLQLPDRAVVSLA